MAGNPYNYHLLQDRLAKLNQRRLTVRQIADEMGVTTVYVHKILSGERWHEPAVRKVAKALGISFKSLLKTTNGNGSESK